MTQFEDMNLQGESTGRLTPGRSPGKWSRLPRWIMILPGTSVAIQTFVMMTGLNLRRRLIDLCSARRVILTVEAYRTEAAHDPAC